MGSCLCQLCTCYSKLRNFYAIIANIIKTFVPLKKKCTKISHKRLPRHILRLVHKKVYAWRCLKLVSFADNIQIFKLCSNSLRTAIKAYRIKRDTANSCGLCSKHFYNIVSKRMYPSRESFLIMDNNDNPLYSDIVKAELFNNAFMQNFSTYSYTAPTPVLLSRPKLSLSTCVSCFVLQPLLM